MPKKLVICTTEVSNDTIRRETRDGIEHIVLTSRTLPPNIVMNRIRYPASVINKSFQTLDRTLAPVEHPSLDGMFVSANDPVAINEYYCGVWNENVIQIDDGRIQIDKVINVSQALKSERGKRLLDRVTAIESGEDSRSIHTSVGAFCELELFEKPKVAEDGEEYDSEVIDMIFDHDAILLDSVGAATPDQGVGIHVNKMADGTEVIFSTIKGDKQSKSAKDMRTNQDISFDKIRDRLWREINKQSDLNMWVMEVFDNYFIFENGDTGDIFKSNYTVDDNSNVSIDAIRELVERVVQYRAINQSTNGDDIMRDSIIAELVKLGVFKANSDADNFSDEQLLAKHKEALIANKGDDDADNQAGNNHTDDSEETGDITINQVYDMVKGLTTKVSSLSDGIKANSDRELADKIAVIRKNPTYADWSEKALTGIANNDNEFFDKIFNESNIQSNALSYGVGSTTQFGDNGQTNEFTVNTKIEDLPE